MISSWRSDVYPLLAESWSSAKIFFQTDFLYSLMCQVARCSAKQLHVKAKDTNTRVHGCEINVPM